MEGEKKRQRERKGNEAIGFRSCRCLGSGIEGQATSGRPTIDLNERCRQE